MLIGCVGESTKLDILNRSSQAVRLNEENINSVHCMIDACEVCDKNMRTGALIPALTRDKSKIFTISFQNVVDSSIAKKGTYCVNAGLPWYINPN